MKRLVFTYTAGSGWPRTEPIVDLDPVIVRIVGMAFDIRRFAGRNMDDMEAARLVTPWQVAFYSRYRYE